ncbi:MAG: hypothetical protein HXX08_08325 [Chloroflexi bacterium]|uniref:Uncharacterized protein n=1 Tax=Candidatus Chlorohelix allophototropha TaxID=3003348 RepID=A0A8T7M1D1_9CHLR|nr:hypothetical protein [Chloroflexota bacterium]WJW67733.1 hypothetical protein OZ401_001008 [Chloroflexota bacterium L227-S17]
METLPFEECHKLAAQSLKSMINRLDSKPFDLDEQKLLMFEALQHGLTIEYMTLTVDLLLDTIFIESKKGITSAEVRETLVAKATYFMNLLKSTMAAAFVKYNLE